MVNGRSPMVSTTHASAPHLDLRLNAVHLCADRADYVPPVPLENAILQARVCVSVSVSVSVSVCVCVCACVRIYMLTCMHASMHACRHVGPERTQVGARLLPSLRWAGTGRCLPCAATHQQHAAAAVHHVQQEHHAGAP